MNGFLLEVKENTIIESQKISSWQKIEAEYKDILSYKYLNNWEEIELPAEWSEAEQLTTFFKSDFAFPADNQENMIWKFDFETGGEALLSINGEIVHGLDRNHKEMIIDSNQYAGQEVELVIEAALDRINKIYLEIEGYKHSFSRAEFKIVDREGKSFYYNLLSLFELKNELQGIEKEKYKKIEVIYQKLKEMYYNQKRKNAKIDFKFLNKVYHSEIEKIESENNYKIACFGHAHIDLAWLWQFKETVRKSARSFSTALNLLKAYPEFKFIQSQPKLYQYMEECFPELFARIKEEVKENNWQVEGGMWVEADTNLISGESLVRQFLYGKKYIKDHFGEDSKVLWLPDVFGYTASLPQIMKKAEVDYFMTSKISWNDTNDFPYSIFNWVGIDGSEVLTHVPRVILPYTYNGEVDAAKIKEIENNYEEQKKENVFDYKFGDSSNYFKKDRVIPDNNLIYIYGYGDGGGGVTEEFIEKLKRFKELPYLADIDFSQPREYFKRIDQERKENNISYPDWRGELYLEYHRGTYTSQAEIKLKNRRLEEKLKKAEILNTIYQITDQKTLEKLWQDVLSNQFHDILPGTSIKEVYQDVNQVYKKVEQELNQIINDNLEQALSLNKNSSDADQKTLDNNQVDYFVVWNSLGRQRNSYLEIECSQLNIDFEAGIRVQSWPEAEDLKFCFKKDLSSKEMLKIYLDKISGLSAKIIKIEAVGKNNSKEFKSSYMKKNYIPNQLQEKSAQIENQYYRLQFDSQGRISSIYDKKLERELIESGEKANQLQFFVDQPPRYDAWEIEADFAEKEIKNELNLETLTVAEDDLEKRAIISWTFRDSTIKQEIILLTDKKRIDFKSSLDWQEREILVKTAFPVNLLSEQASYEIAFGQINRPTTSNTDYEKAQFEVPAHRWADLSESGFGVSLLNDSKYGYDIKNNLMRLTLLKSSNYPDPTADAGKHNFIYSLYSHSGSLRKSRTLNEAENINEKLVSKKIKSVRKYMGDETTHNLLNSILEFKKGKSRLTALKKAEKDKAVILRFYEPYGGRDRIKIKIADYFKIEKVAEVNLLENPVEKQSEIKLDNNLLSFELSKFEIKTIKLYLK
ncbi:alpha-mannosidase [Halanaerobium saccharolyticum]|uniref:Alpha-mannosidase n=1 Tax=Halanaerobium saccharolyticum TaxID=43595 RepID=A0A4R6SE37_9FIRM|nr:glycoside hydrolase family 38 C-terminal domain-containing protein [Halanaerobium saccharolyticum]TDP98211.1 alpha-mannosidase [Halanaerobium saccharolyticum]